MNPFLPKLLARTLLSTACLLFASVEATAQITPIANGHLKGGPTITTPEPSVLDLTFHLVELPNGTLVGGGKLTKKSSDGWIRFDLTSYVFVDDVLLVAGPVIQVHEGSEPTPWQVGDTFFMAVHDGATPDLDRFIEGGVPSAFGPLTAQEILMLVGPPPPEIFRPAISGNLLIH